MGSGTDAGRIITSPGVAGGTRLGTKSLVIARAAMAGCGIWPLAELLTASLEGFGKANVCAREWVLLNNPQTNPIPNQPVVHFIV